MTQPPKKSAGQPSRPVALLLHLHPKMIPEEALAFSRTCGLGGMALVLFLTLAVTGGLLLLAYEPSVERAYVSVVAIRDDIPFGPFVRSIHHWAGSGLIVVVFLHLLRVFYTGAFQPPRGLNWLLGLGLMLLVMGSAFTGYLLPWDQLAYWAVTIGTGMLEYVPHVGPRIEAMVRGGSEVGPRTLTLFFVLHIAILPLVLVASSALHFWLVRKAGGVMLEPGERNPVPSSPHLVLREGVVALVMLAGLFVFSAVVEAPLLEEANPGLSPNPAKAPWYFLGLQELLVHFHPSFAVLVLPVLAAGFLVLVPYLARGETATGRWFHSDLGRRLALASAGAALVITPALVLADARLGHPSRWLSTWPAAVTDGLLPTMALVGFVLACYRLARRWQGASRLESIQAVFTLLAVAFVILTITGVLFRGEGMRLAWPWDLKGGP